MTEKQPSQIRVLQTFLGPSEKKVLLWLAARMPAWVTPDFLTFVGIVAALIIAVSLVLTNISPAFLWLASFGVVLNWFGDSLDGTLARYRKIERSNYGYFIDHSVDTANEVLIFLALGLSPYVRMELAGLALVSYLMMSVQVFLYTQVKGVFQISFIRLGPTEVRLIMVLSNAVVFFVGNPTLSTPVGVFTFYDLIVSAISLLLLVIFFVVTITRSRELAALDEYLLSLRDQRAKNKEALLKKREERDAARQNHRGRRRGHGSQHAPGL